MLSRDDDQFWQAVKMRDAAFDGRFVYAVRTTGVYCRPSCPSRRARAANVAFFDTPAAAEAQGYRPCLRCNPTGMTASQANALIVAEASASDPARRLLFGPDAHEWASAKCRKLMEEIEASNARS